MLRPYRDFAPTGFDCKGLALPDQQDWLVVPVGQNRDSEALSRSNYRTAVKMLKESKDVVVYDEDICFEEHEFNHWACGWFGIIIVKPGTDCERIAKEIESRMEDHPVLDEDDWSTLENEEWDEQEDLAINSLKSCFGLTFEDYYDKEEGVSWYTAKVPESEDADEIERHAEQDGLKVEFDEDGLIYVRFPRGE